MSATTTQRGAKKPRPGGGGDRGQRKNLKGRGAICATHTKMGEEGKSSSKRRENTAFLEWHCFSLPFGWRCCLPPPFVGGKAQAERSTTLKEEGRGKQPAPKRRGSGWTNTFFANNFQNKEKFSWCSSCGAYLMITNEQFSSVKLLWAKISRTSFFLTFFS